MSTRDFMLITLAAGLVVTRAAAAESDAAAAETARRESLTLGMLALRLPAYEGSEESITTAAPIVAASYQSDIGTWALDATGLSWTITESSFFSAGLTLGYDTGRDDSKEADAYGSGSKRLRGLGKIEGTLELGAFGAIVLGQTTPLILAVRKAPSGDGHGGTLVDLQIEQPIALSEQLGISLSPYVTWADRRYTATYFGVTPAQSRRSDARYRPYQADAGIKSYGISITLDYAATEHWIVSASGSLSRLSGDAARSPIVESKTAATYALGLKYTF